MDFNNGEANKNEVVELRFLRATIEKLKQDVEELEADEIRLAEEVDLQRLDEINALNDELNTAADELQRLRASIAEKNAEIVRLQERVSQLENEGLRERGVARDRELEWIKERKRLNKAVKSSRRAEKTALWVGGSLGAFGIGSASFSHWWPLVANLLGLH